MQPDQQRLTCKEVEDILGVSKSWLSVRRKQIGTGPDFFKIGKKIWYRKQDVERWNESRRNGGMMPT